MDERHRSPNGREKGRPDRLFGRPKACVDFTRYTKLSAISTFSGDFAGDGDPRSVGGSGGEGTVCKRLVWLRFFGAAEAAVAT
jgi:hypothetical protein